MNEHNDVFVVFIFLQMVFSGKGLRNTQPLSNKLIPIPCTKFYDLIHLLEAVQEQTIGVIYHSNFQRNPIVFVKKSSGVCKQDAKSASQSYSRVHILAHNPHVARKRERLLTRFQQSNNVSCHMGVCHQKRGRPAQQQTHFKLLNLLIRMCIKGVKMVLPCQS